MVNFTSNTYQMKREILTFSQKVSKNLSKPDSKFIADMSYKGCKDLLLQMAH